MITWITEKRKLSDLNPAKYNPRKWPEKETKDLEQSLKKFNVADPIVINANNTIIGGHFRVNILKNKGLQEIDCRIPSRLLTDEEERELNLRLNKNLGEWDFETLANFDEDMLKDVGFTSEELDKIFQLEPEGKEDEVPDERETDIKLGDMFQLGNHRLLCGDATKREDVERLMDGQKADMVFTDPPYNVNYSGCGVQTSNQIMNDKMGMEEFNSFLAGAFSNYKTFSKGGAALYICHGDGKPMVRVAFETNFNKFFKQSATIVWVKNVASMGYQHYRGKHEPILYGWNDEKSPFYGDRKQTTVWEVKRETNYKHPTQKPVELIERAINNSAKREDIVLDLFGGSGSTMIACERLNRKCYMMELDPKYCQVIIDRWENYTNQKAEKI